jgi:conjugal transfer/type IV secretion protein DotA/TraY
MAISPSSLTPDSLTSAGISSAGGDAGMSASDMLIMIFGEITKNPLAALNGGAMDSTVLSIVFMYINIGLMTLGSLYLTYKTLSAITQTAHDGDFIGKAFHTVWVPIRITTGIMMLIPIAGGWNGLQIIMLWIGVMGAGLGNMAWREVVDGWINHDAKKTNVAMFVQFSNGNALADSAFKALLCDEMNVAARAANTEGGTLASAMAGISTTIGAVVGSSGASSLKPGEHGINNGGYLCGKWYVADQGTSVTRSTNNGKPLSVGGASMTTSPAVLMPGELTLAEQVANASALLTQEMIDDVRLIAKDAIADIRRDQMAAQSTAATTGGQPVDFIKYLDRLKTAGNKYQGNLSARVNSILNSAAKQDQMAPIVMGAAAQYGFTSAGSFYTAYANSSYSINSAANAFGAISVIATPDNSPKPMDLYNRYSIALEAAKAKTQKGSANLDESSSEQGVYGLLIDKMGWLNPGEAFVRWFTSHDSTAPALVNIKNTADDVVLTTAAIITGVGIVQGALEGQGKSIENLIPVVGAVKGGVAGAFTPWLEMIKFVAQMSLGFFLMCSIYLPLVPYIVFMGQIMEWLATVVMGVSAAPFLAFAHFDTDGEGLGQKTQHGYTFALSSFMRPVLLVLGFIISAAFIEVSIRFLTISYSFAVHDAQVHSMTGLIAMFGYCALYMVLAVGFVNTSCSLMYLIPDGVLEFMGARSVGMGFGKDTAGHAQNAALGGAGVTRSVSGKGPKVAQSQKQRDNAGIDEDIQQKKRDEHTKQGAEENPKG